MDFFDRVEQNDYGYAISSSILVFKSVLQIKNNNLDGSGSNQYLSEKAADNC